MFKILSTLYPFESFEMGFPWVTRARSPKSVAIRRAAAL